MPILTRADGAPVSPGGRHKRQPSDVNVNKNTTWLSTSAAWAWYLGLIVLGWLLISAIMDDAGLAWTYVHLVHGVITYYLLHWSKGSAFADDDGGKYSRLTFWEQVDNGMYGTHNRKLLTAAPVVLFLLATNGADFRKQPLGLNLVVVLVLVVAKLPALHRVRFFGINKY